MNAFIPRDTPRRIALAIALACACAAAGLFTIHTAVGRLFAVWRDNDLKSIGLVVPFISFALILRVWRQLGWETEDGTWWGLGLLAVTSLLVFIRDHMLFIVTVDSWLVQIPPLPLLAAVYATAIVLLVGGVRLVKAAAFPLLLLLLVIPVPQTFSNVVDLPLQHASATVARHFAMALGQPLTQDKLRLMFTPEFGMFIAPGCNGIRGSITLGLVALVVGYLYRFRWFVWAPVVVGSVLLGYLFNFVRLCVLVIYYKIALPYPWLRNHARGADFCIGGTLFVCAVFLFIFVANRLRRDPDDVVPEAAVDAPHAPRNPRSYYLRTGALLLLSLVFFVDFAHSYRSHERLQELQAQAVVFPEQLGQFHLVRTWNETMIEGTIVYAWAEYANPASGAHVSLGISPRLGMHDTTTCHLTRGDDPLLHRELDATTANGPASFSATLYNTGSTLRLEAASVCQNGDCRQFTDNHQHVTLVYNHPDARVATGLLRPVPILLKADTDATSVPMEQAASQLSAEMQAFLAGVDLNALTRAYSTE
jgi:exosortase J